MQLTVLLSVCVSLATTSLCSGEEFSQVRDLPALKMGATDLDAILLETHALIDAANGPEDSGRETVRVSIDGQDIEIPHLSLASSVAFPNEVFGFSYMYNQDDKPISSVTIDLGDSLRRVSVSGEFADKVEALSKLLEKDFHRYSTLAGGVKFRRVAGICLSMLFLTSLMISSAYYWNTETVGRWGCRFVPQSVSCSCFSSRGTDFFPALCFISAIHPFFSSDMRLKSFSYALSRLSWEFHYPIFFYKRSGSDLRIFCAVTRHLIRKSR